MAFVGPVFEVAFVGCASEVVLVGPAFEMVLVGRPTVDHVRATGTRAKVASIGCGGDERGRARGVGRDISNR